MSIWDIFHVARGSKVDCNPSENEVEGSNHGVLSFFYFLYTVLIFFFLLGTVCAFTTRVPGSDSYYFSCTLLYDVLQVMYLYIPATYFCCYWCSVLPYCCSSSCAGWQNLLRCGSLHLIPVFFLCIIQTQDTFYVHTPWQYCRICSLDLPVTRITYPR